MKYLLEFSIGCIIICFYILNNLLKYNEDLSTFFQIYEGKYKEHFSEINLNVNFINKNDLINILKNDNDNYYKTFFKKDLDTRKIKSIEEYFNYIENSASDFTKEEIKKLLKCIKIADKKIDNIKLDWFDGKKANKIVWKIGCIKGTLYENGLPHTRNDIILISKDYLKNNDIRIIKTLIHEKVHIYQKIYISDTDKFIKYYNYTILKERDKDDNIRANPDLNNFIYKDNNNNINKAIYNSNPKNIEDITYYPINNQSYEHPFEKMAIDIENYDKSRFSFT